MFQAFRSQDPQIPGGNIWKRKRARFYEGKRAMSANRRAIRTEDMGGGEEEEGLLEEYHNENRFMHPKKRGVRVSDRRALPPFKTTLAAIIMVSVGLLMLFVGIRRFVTSSEHHIGGVLVIGLLTMIPGTYASFILFGTWMGWPDYDYSQVPSYDD
jgi:hypothetical protein